MPFLGNKDQVCVGWFRVWASEYKHIALIKTVIQENQRDLLKNGNTTDKELALFVAFPGPSTPSRKAKQRLI